LADVDRPGAVDVAVQTDPERVLEVHACFQATVAAAISVFAGIGFRTYAR